MSKNNVIIEYNGTTISMTKYIELLQNKSIIDLWVVWRFSDADANKYIDQDDKTEIYGIYKNKNIAISECNKYNKKFVQDGYFKITSKDVKIADLSFGAISDIDEILDDNVLYCTKLPKFYSVDNKLYFLITQELPEAESYCSGQQCIYVCETKHKTIEKAMSIFDQEHYSDNSDEDGYFNDNGNFEFYNDGKSSAERFIEKLEKTNFCEIICGDNMGHMSFSIVCKKIL